MKRTDLCSDNHKAWRSYFVRRGVNSSGQINRAPSLIDDLTRHQRVSCNRMIVYIIKDKVDSVSLHVVSHGVFGLIVKFNDAPLVEQILL